MDGRQHEVGEPQTRTRAEENTSKHGRQALAAALCHRTPFSPYKPKDTSQHRREEQHQDQGPPKHTNRTAGRSHRTRGSSTRVDTRSGSRQRSRPQGTPHPLLQPQREAVGGRSAVARLCARCGLDGAVYRREALGISVAVLAWRRERPVEHTVSRASPLGQDLLHHGPEDGEAAEQDVWVDGVDVCA